MLDVFVGFEQKDLLLLVVVLHCLGLPDLDHLYHQLQLLVELLLRVLLRSQPR